MPRLPCRSNWPRRLGAGALLSTFPSVAATSERCPAAEVAKATRDAEHLIKQQGVLERLCPALRTVSGDLGAVAKAITPALLPLAIGPQAVLSITPLAFGALAVVVVRAEVRALCVRRAVEEVAD